MGGKAEAMRDVLIGVDVGTSALKAVAFSQDGSVLASTQRSYPVSQPAPNHAEQNAEDWWGALVAAVRALVESIDPSRVCALGLSTQGGTLQPVDARGTALQPAISWMDTRATQQEAIFRDRIGGEQMHAITGWNLCGGLNALQILWLRQNKPELFRAAAQFLSVPGYLTQRLTGCAAVDRSSAGVEQLLDVRTGRYSEPILELLGIDERRLAELVDAHESVGTLIPEAAQALGLPQSVTVAVGGHDQYCAALGAGLVSGKDRLIATGTAWAVVAATDTPAAPTAIAAVSRHVVPGLWGAMLSLDNGGASLEWLRNALKPLNADLPLSLEQVNNLAAASLAGAEGLIFYPYFSGAEFPAGLKNAKAGFVNLRPSHDARHMARAVMEGVACQAIWMLEALGQEADGELILTGGASKSALWTGIIADLVGRALTLPNITEAGGVGAAALAGTAAGLYASPAQASAVLCGKRHCVQPGPNQSTYRQVLANYKEGAARMTCA
jgi:sugar (pentulose or hexulose) kinase